LNNRLQSAMSREQSQIPIPAGETADESKDRDNIEN
jgi:hypothetical protein